ncbi:SWIM zinc finger family protein [Kribbella sp. CA-293567]|uniref:SWIM zinc finger family protein n=1 Tax=Kribbella sp. CA-293567 TaxID=3002436 RepID=UPI0022DDDA53|nr:SWIM zinc finger family protein [Kribbella sp. CA-293567]WBQ07788.1 SWIM zinc finger family protein [Kribbella sp. CA-293567]
MNERTPWQGWRQRDGENAGLPAAKGAGSRRPFGGTWWGKAWLGALERQAQLDSNRLGRGRSYARRGSVLSVEVEPGVVRASVQGSRVTPYEVTVKIRAFDDREWEAVLDVVSAQIGRVAALLDGELPPELVDDAQAAGLELLPDSGEVRTACNCPDYAVPCKHSAAVCYLIADALDDDPFELLLLRGKQKDELLSALRARRATSAEPPAIRRQPVGVLAKAAFQRSPGPLPKPVRPLSQPGAPTAVQVLEPPRQSGVEGKDLVALATDAARRAWELAAGDGDGGLGLTREQDLARRAANLFGTPGLADLAHRSGLTARQLTSWAVAWREGGAGGLAAATDHPADLDPSVLAEGLEALGGVIEGNRVTAGRTQLRLGPDGLWYLFTKQFSDWMLSAPPGPDPAELLGRP